MKKLTREISMAGLLLSAFLSGCQTPSHPPAPATAAALYWVQNAGEYRALAYQAYNVARERFDHSASSSRRVVVMDLDETVLDNSAYAVWCLRQGIGYSDETWNRWVTDAAATAVPGAIEFIQHVRKKGGTVFFISNRVVAGADATRINLARLGINGIDEKHLLLKQREYGKALRFQEVIKSEGEPILFVGDNLTDFGLEAAPLKSADDLQAFVRRHHDDFGVQFIVLPNPLYGSWLPGRSEDLQSGLKTWTGNSSSGVGAP